MNGRKVVGKPQIQQEIAFFLFNFGMHFLFWILEVKELRSKVKFMNLYGHFLWQSNDTKEKKGICVVRQFLVSLDCLDFFFSYLVIIESLMFNRVRSFK